MNVIVICTDTFRADYLGCYGNKEIKTPRLDRFAERSILFENCYGESLPTIQARRIWCTGRSIIPFKKDKPPKGIYPDLPGWRPLANDDVTIAEILKEKGYFTGLVTDVWHYFKPGMNLHRGYRNWQFIRGQEADPWRTGNKELFNPRDHIPEKFWTRFYEENVLQYLINTQDFESESDYFCAQTFATAAAWLEDNLNRKPFYLWVDTFDPHEPFDCPKEYAEMYHRDYPCERYIFAYGADASKAEPEDIPPIRGLYSGLVSLVDRWAGYLLDVIERLDLFQDTLVVFTSDHGTEFLEHGHLQKHPHLLHHQVVRIPLIVHHPDPSLAGKRVKGLVSALDFVPTFLKFLGEDGAEDLDGEDFLALATGEKDKIHDYVYTGYGGYGSVRTLEWNLIFPAEGRSSPPADGDGKLPPDLLAHARERRHPPRLYDLRNDFDEMEDVSARHPEVMRELSDLARKKWPGAVLDGGGRSPE